MTAFFGVWRFTRRIHPVGSLPTVSLATPNEGYSTVQRAAKVLSLAVSEPPNYPKGFGLKPFSMSTEARLCVWITGLEPVTYRLSGDCSSN